MSTDALISAVLRLRAAIRSTREPATVEILRKLEVDLRRELGSSIRMGQAARALGITTAALGRWIDRGFLPIVVGGGRKRAELATAPVLELADRVAGLRSRGIRRPLAQAVRSLGWREDPEGRQVLSAEVAVLPRSNVPVLELRADYRRTTPAQRVLMTAELSHALSVMAMAGAVARRAASS